MNKIKFFNITLILIFQSIALAIVQFKWENDDMKNLQEAFRECVANGASNEFPNMFQRTFISDKAPLNTACEKSILAIDFGGTSLKLGFYDLTTGVRVEIKTQVIKIPQKDEIQALDAFDWVASKVRSFLEDCTNNTDIIAGLTFSYAMEQTSLCTGKILSLGKNFHFKKLEPGSDPIKLLTKSFTKENLNISLVALANDTVATLMSVDKKENQHRIGIVLGTGTNAAYFKQEKGRPVEATNLEWASFDTKTVKMNSFDIEFKEDLDKKGIESALLDRYVGGLGFLYLLNKAARAEGLLKDGTSYSIEYVNSILKGEVKNPKLHRIIEDIKTRSMQVIVSLVAGLVENMGIDIEREGLTLVLNGTIFEQSFDFEIFKKELVAFFKSNEFLNKIDINFERPPDASLIGMVNIIRTQVLDVQ